MSAEFLLEIVPGLSAEIKKGRMLDAWEIGKRSGVPLQDWPPGEPLKLAARLADRLGASRLGRILHWKNWRADRSDAARYFEALFVRASWVSSDGQLAEIDRFLADHPGLPPEERADLLSFQCWLHASQRDLKQAERLSGEMLRLQPESSWIWVSHSDFLKAADRYAESLEAARRALELEPDYRAAVLRCTGALTHLGRDDEALELLLATHDRCQQADLALQLQVMFSEREDHERALWALDEVVRLSPLMDRPLEKWVAGRRADFLLMAGDTAGFLECADLKGEGFHAKAAAHFRRVGGEGLQRKRLPVPFVRQHRSTCAPSTLAALAAYWGRTYDHLAIADAICHEGTPWHKERAWVEAHGFIAREFRLTRESLRALIDRGVPFTLTTEWTTGAHLQACIGYDARTDSVLLRDPTERHFGEMLMETLLEDHPLAGPRAMLMVPVEKSALLDGIVLADEFAYDSYHRLLVSLDTHDRFKIEAAVVELRTVAPDHLLAWLGEMRAAQAQEDWGRGLAAVEVMLARLPDYETLLLFKVNLLLQLRRRRELRELLERIVANPKSDPIFISELGELLLEDARELEMADHHLRRAMRRRRGESRVFENLAQCRMKQRRFEEAARLCRAASCLAPTFEPYAQGYFNACRIIGRPEEALEYFRERTQSQGTKDHGPWLTLARALNDLQRVTEAAAVLEQAARSRPDDGGLMLYGGRLMAFWGPEHRERGWRWIEEARGRVPEPAWLREAAETAGSLGERRRAIRHWQSLIALRPEQTYSWRALARLIAEEEGTAAAIRLLDDGVVKHPESAGLWSLLAEWLVPTPRGPMAALDRFLELEPKSVWGFRERALRRMEKNRHEEALEDANEAVSLNPFDADSLVVLGFVYAGSGRKAEAAAVLRQALTLAVDTTDAASELLGLCADEETALEALRFIEDEMQRQVSNGDIVPLFQRLAWRWIEPPLLLSKLQAWCRERPDLWQTWSARIEQALRMQMPEEAALAADTMTRTFPLMPRAWLDLAKVHQAAGRESDEVIATGKALEISPAWDVAARAHADALERIGRTSEAEAILRKAVEHEPLTPANHGYLADLIRRSGRRREAWDLMAAALDKVPFYGWGWTALARWSTEDDQSGKFEDCLRNASGRNGHRRSWWPIAADAWAELNRQDEVVAAIRKGLEIAPRDQGLRDQLASALVAEQKFDEALAACGPVADEEREPRELEGRRAWVLMQSGKPVEAIRQMRELLGRHPDYVWGMTELIDWLARRGEWTAVGEIARKWTRIAPQEARAYGFLGQAEEELSDLKAAEEAYQKAYLLQPDYTFAGRRLLELQMKSRRFDDGAATLRRLRYYAPSVGVECDGIELDLQSGNLDAALAAAGKILEDPRADTGVLDWVNQLFSNSNQTEPWKSLFKRRLDEGGNLAPGALAAFFGLIPPEKLAKEGCRRIKRQPVDSPIRIEGWRRLIELVAGRSDRKSIVRWWKRDAAELARHGVLWNEVGGAFLSISDFKRGVTWLADWESRGADVTPKTLFWYAALCEGHPGDEEKYWQKAEAARIEVLRRFPGSSVTAAVRASLAFHRAAAGDPDGARHHLSEYESAMASDYYRHYANFAEGIVAAGEGNEAIACEKMREAAAYFSQYNAGVPPRLMKRACQAAAAYLPWTKGSGNRLRRKWKLPKAQPIFWWNREVNLPSVLIPVVAIVTIAVVRSCAGP